MKKPALKRKQLAVALSALALAAGFGVWNQRAHRAESSAPEASLKFAFDWPRGATYTYSLAWQGETLVRVQELGSSAKDGKGLEGKVDLAADLVLRSHGKRGDAYLLSARLEHPTRHELTVLGRPALPNDDAVSATFAGREALIEVDPSGVVRGVYFAKDAPPIFRSMMQSIAELSQVVVPAGASTHWSTSESTPVGRGTADYFVEETDLPRVLRTRHAYDAIYGMRRKLTPGAMDERDDAVIQLDPKGHVALLDEEKLAVHAEKVGAPDELASSTTFRLTLRETGHADDSAEPNLASLDLVPAGDVAPSERAHAQVLEQRVAGLTAEDLSRDLLSAALVGSAIDKDWLLRGSGLLKQHPSLCLDMVTLFEDARMNARGRAQIMDLLAGTGTPQAQEAMRTALESTQARDDSHLFNALVQRFSFVSHPTPESIAFVAQAMQDAKAGSARTAATYALGAIAGNALRAGDGTAGQKYGAPMLRSLAAAHTPDEKRALAAGLGNLGWNGAVPKLRELAHDSDASVRGAAAWSLRKTDTPEVRETLLDLAIDASPEVEDRALEAMATLPSLDADDLTSLSRAVAAGATSPHADSTLLTLLTAHQDGGEPVASMLRVLLARNDADKPMAAEIRHVLAAMQ